MQKIIPAILATSEEEYSDKLEKIESSGFFEWVQVDFMDGEFVPSKSISAEVVKKYPTSLKKEAHLMVWHPEDWVHELIKQKFNRIILHLESEDPNRIMDRYSHDDLHINLDRIEDDGLKIVDGKTVEEIESGLAIKLDTPLSDLDPYLMDINVLLIMAVEPGSGGQEFDLRTLERVKEAFKIRQEKKLLFTIGVDGGVSRDNVRMIIEAGADYVVVGSHIFEGDLEKNVQELNKQIAG